MANKITRNQFIEKVEKSLNHDRPTGNSFAARGARTRYDSAASLLKFLKSGGKPSVNQIVGWFGKGARFED
jgi:hypothetical protein